MTTENFIKHEEALFTKCLDTLKKKNADYSGNAADPFKNFKMVEAFGITDVEQGILVRLSDKFARICNLLHNEAQVKSESIEDTIEDAINYFAILHAYRKSKPEVIVPTRRV